jgi:hypothetical protein
LKAEKITEGNQKKKKLYLSGLQKDGHLGMEEITFM